MTKTKLLISAACAGLITAGISLQAQAIIGLSDDKCYGIAKARQNSCASATGVHSCKGQAEIDDDPGDFVPVVPVDCLKYGGKLTPPPAPAAKPESDQ